MRRHLSFVIYPEIIDVTHPQNGGYDYKAKGFFSEWGPTYRDIHKIGEFELELSFIYRGDKASDVLFTDWNVKMSDAPESKQQSLLERARKLRP